ncbi:MAG: hypothetical protein BHW30_05395 [Firmicutes bacterium CAG_194_44_15]|nr:MAG: hypothetical protein BHW30_05395 [Firmicutes bacterium CAG_194_44_15]
MTLGSLFDGIAGFPLAAERQGIKTIWTSEIEANCTDILQRLTGEIFRRLTLSVLEAPARI